jgi:CRISPR system Cascade subunit CasC
MLVEFHMIQNHSSSNLNRDDTGSPKDCMFGGARRARISSQCLKRTIRRSDLFQSTLSHGLATRTRKLPELVKERLIAAGLTEAMAEVAAKKASGFGNKDGKENDKKLETAQTMLLSEADIQVVCDILLKTAKSAATPDKFEKVNAKDLQADSSFKNYRPVTVDIALFGRMITSDAFRDAEASAQVAHAVSTHKVEQEFDYFTAVDDLMGDNDAMEDAGADMIGDVEFNSACYYKYFSIDVCGLIDNLTGKRLGNRAVTQKDRQHALQLAVETLGAFLMAAALITPSGKQNTFAAHQPPALILVETRSKRIPISYANAFVLPVRASEHKSIVLQSMEKLAEHAKQLTEGFNLEAINRSFLSPTEPGFSLDGAKRYDNLNEMIKALKETVTTWANQS